MCTLEHGDEEVEENQIAHDEVYGVKHRQEHVDYFVDVAGIDKRWVRFFLVNHNFDAIIIFVVNYLKAIVLMLWHAD